MTIQVFRIDCMLLSREPCVSNHERRYHDGSLFNKHSFNQGLKSLLKCVHEISMKLYSATAVLPYEIDLVEGYVGGFHVTAKDKVDDALVFRLLMMIICEWID